MFSKYGSLVLDVLTQRGSFDTTPETLVNHALEALSALVIADQTATQAEVSFNGRKVEWQALDLFGAAISPHGCYGGAMVAVRNDDSFLRKLRRSESKQVSAHLNSPCHWMI